MQGILLASRGRRESLSLAAWKYTAVSIATRSSLCTLTCPSKCGCKAFLSNLGSFPCHHVGGEDIFSPPMRRPGNEASGICHSEVQLRHPLLSSHCSRAWHILAVLLPQRRLDKVMCTKYQFVELVKESLPINLLWWIEAVPSLIPE